MADGQWDHPGGTREPGEPFVETARRELLEEAGARLLSLQPFGLIRCHSHQEKAYRPHMPHPDFIHVTVVADVKVVGVPQNPPGEGEVVEFAETVSLQEAASRFRTREDGGGWMADLYRLGAHIRGLI
jgi:8-oxo-dGTP pyrophosphatase MutT (NUDIX family)